MLQYGSAVREDSQTDLHWVRDLTVLTHLGLTGGPSVPHNLISTQESPVPLPKFQMALRFKILMSSGSKGPSNTILYTQKSRQANPLHVPQWGNYRERYRLTGHFYISLNVFPSGSAVREPPPIFPNRVTMDGGITRATRLLIHSFILSFIHSFIHVCLQQSPKSRPPTYGEKQSHRPQNPTQTEGLHTVGRSAAKESETLSM